ncbi:MAG: DNA alkylation repair protein [Verrucomicrobiaceae bacterium]|nr:DNA alkylation repair protein [Verrucomicrobiaceae bacterium]
MSLDELRRQFRKAGEPAVAEVMRRFFKTGPGEYGEGDKFLGLKVPTTRSFLPDTDSLLLNELEELLHSDWHEERLLALLALVRRYKKARKDLGLREAIVAFYLKNTRWINNWDLVDTSAPHILGEWLFDRDRAVLRRLARSKDLWEQRIAVLATQAFIRKGDFDLTLELCHELLSHKHDLMHKACGWMLREIGNRDVHVLLAFLDRHAHLMPRTMLRYAIEKLPEKQRMHVLATSKQ